MRDRNAFSWDRWMGRVERVARLETGVLCCGPCRRKQRISLYRHAVCYVAHRKVGMPLALVGAKINMHHSSVLYGVREVSRRMKLGHPDVIRAYRTAITSLIHERNRQREIFRLPEAKENIECAMS